MSSLTKIMLVLFICVVLGLAFCSRRPCCNCSHHEHQTKSHQPDTPAQPVTFNGNATLQDQTFAVLTINGAADLTHVTVNEKLLVNGSLTAHTLQTPFVQIAGGATIADSSVDSLEVAGSLIALNSKFDAIEATSNELILDGSECATLVMHATPIGTQQRVILRNGATVTGAVTFERDGGTVINESGNAISASIIGGVDSRLDRL